MSLHFTAIGMPATKGSTRAFARGGRIVVTATNPRTKPWEAVVAAAALEAGAEPLDGPIAVGLVFRLPRPAGHFGKRGLRPTAPAWPARRPDLDKLIRAVLDALTGICWRDDSRVVEIRATKGYAGGGDKPCGVTVTVVPAMNAPWRTP